MNKILVTGGTGYIGSHTVVELLEMGCEVVIADNLSNSYHEVLNRIEEITKKRPIFCQGDLTDSNFTETLFKTHSDINGVIHFAASKYINESVEEPLRYYNNNLQSLMNVLAQCALHKVQRFVFSSSCSVYGSTTESPVNEQTALANSESPYAETKLMGERIIRDVCLSNELNVCLLRYFNPIGAHSSGLIGENSKIDPQNIVPRIIGTATGLFEQFEVSGDDYDTPDGTCVRDYVHVCDIARAHCLALNWLEENPSNQAAVFNLGSGNGVSVLQMIKAFEAVTGINLNYKITHRRPGDVVSIYADNSKAQTELGWVPKFDLQQMMRSAWNWSKK